MRYSPEHKAEARAKIVDAAGRAFRRNGYGGIGVDGLAKEAGVTSGAFYGHFKSKDAAFAEIALQGIEQLCSNILALRSDHGAGWVAAFVDLYVGDLRTCELGESCALQSLTPDVMRADLKTRQAYEAAMMSVIGAVADGLDAAEPAEREDQAWALLSMLSGGVTVARSMASAERSASVAKALRKAALALVA